MGFALPIEPRYVLFLPPAIEEYAKANTDQFGDSYTTPLDENELEKVVVKLDKLTQIMSAMRSHGTNGVIVELDTESLGNMFARCVVYIDGDCARGGRESSLYSARIYLEFGGARLTSVEDAEITHVVGEDRSSLLRIRKDLSRYSTD